MLWITVVNTIMLPIAAAQSSTIAWTTSADLTQCRESNLTWTGGEPPYSVLVTPYVDGQLSAPARRRLGGTTRQYYEWEVDYATGTQLHFEIADAAGDVGTSITRITVGHGPLSCTLRNAVTSTIVPPADASQWGPAPVNPLSRTAWPQTGDSPIFPPVVVEKHRSNVGIIVGSVIGGVMGLAIIAGLLLWVRQLRKKIVSLKRQIAEYEATGVMKVGYAESVTSQ